MQKEGAMAKGIAAHHRSDGLHDLVYGFIVALSAWLVLSAWGFSFIGGGAGLVLAVVSALILFMVALSGALRHIWRKSSAKDARPAVRSSAAARLSGEFETHTGTVKGSRATIEILLPIAAVAFGLTAFAIIAIVD
jgi:hypothetical protein